MSPQSRLSNVSIFLLGLGAGGCRIKGGGGPSHHPLPLPHRHRLLLLGWTSGRMEGPPESHTGCESLHTVRCTESTQGGWGGGLSIYNAPGKSQHLHHLYLEAQSSLFLESCWVRFSLRSRSSSSSQFFYPKNWKYHGLLLDTEMESIHSSICCLLLSDRPSVGLADALHVLFPKDCGGVPKDSCHFPQPVGFGPAPPGCGGKWLVLVLCPWLFKWQGRPVRLLFLVGGGRDFFEVTFFFFQKEPNFFPIHLPASGFVPHQLPQRHRQHQPQA